MEFPMAEEYFISEAYFRLTPPINSDSSNEMWVSIIALDSQHFYSLSLFWWSRRLNCVRKARHRLSVEAPASCCHDVNKKRTDVGLEFELWCIHLLARLTDLKHVAEHLMKGSLQQGVQRDFLGVRGLLPLLWKVLDSRSDTFFLGRVAHQKTTFISWLRWVVYIFIFAIYLFGCSGVGLLQAC